MTGITVRGGADLRAALATATQLYGRPEPLLKQLGTYVLGYVGQTFRAGGRPAWKPLAESTLAARRQGKGGGSGQPLQNTGRLRNSFELRTSDRQAVVFSTSPVAVFQEFGTRGPYEIRPKNGKALALPFLPFLPGRDGGTGSAGTGKQGRFSLAGLGKGRTQANGGVRTAAGKRATYSNVAFYAHVTHPGLVARPMLPDPAVIQPELVRAAEIFLTRTLLRRAGT